MASKILIIDNNAESIANLKNSVVNQDYEIISCSNGEEGFGLLLSNPEHYSIIVLGQNIDDMQGIRLLYKIKACGPLKHIPVVMEAQTGTDEEMEMSIRAGAMYYIPKPSVATDKNQVLQIIETALRDQKRYTDAIQTTTQHQAYNTLVNAHFRIKTINEAQNLATLLANECPNPRLAAVGINEMLINAIEHGNLQINYKDKSELHATGAWTDELQKRMQQPEYRNKRVDVYFNKTDSNLSIRIVDEGDGFDWRKYQDLDPKRVFDNHGRGIVMARNLAFDNLIYHGKGNDVECVIAL